MSKLYYLGVPAAVVLAYVFTFFLPVVWIGVVASLPLLRIRKVHALLFGFVIGLLAPMSLYLLYPLGMISKLSVAVGQIASIPSFLVIVIFPLFYGIIMGLSGLFWSGLAENPRVSRALRMPRT
jgi:hypothetical protein